MKIGDRVKSKLYSSRGIGKVVGMDTLFDVTYAEVLCKDGVSYKTKLDDLIYIANPLELISKNELTSTSIFFTRFMLLRLQANISENTIVTSTNYKIIPLPHQLLAVNFVINRFQPRSLIADEVGLGKTIEAILVYQEFKLRNIAKRILIVVPSGLVKQWHEELIDKFDEQFMIYDKDFVRALKDSHGKDTNVWTLHDRIITSIDGVKPLRIEDDLDKNEIERRKWHNKHMFDDIQVAGFDILIIDEAHKLSKHGDGSESARFKLGKKLSDAIPVLLLLTATPHQGDEYLFLNLLRLVDPILFTNKDTLKPELVQEVVVRNKKRAVIDFDGNRIFKHRIVSLVEINRTTPANDEEIQLYKYVTEYTSEYYNYAKQKKNQAMMFLVMLYQRIVSSSSHALLKAMQMRKETLAEEVEKIEQWEALDWDEQEPETEEILKKSIFTSKKDIEVEIRFIDRCIELSERIAQSNKDLKFKKLIEIIEELIKREQKPDLKILIFTEFLATQHAIINYLKKFGYDCAYINGSLNRNQRVEQIKDFRSKKQVLVSTDAGGEGLNLQFCYCIVNFDLPWNPARLEQRIGRIDRIGQKHDTKIFNFHLTDTVEDNVRAVLENKLVKIKEQFGEDKYADVLSLLHDEFDFDRIYLEAVRLREDEKEELDRIAESIFKRAKEILDKDELLLPFSQFIENPETLVNTDLNQILHQMVFGFMEYKSMQINPYKDEKGFYYFDNPFAERNEAPRRYRNVTFQNTLAVKRENIDFVNIDHPLVQNIQSYLLNHSIEGTVSSVRIRNPKFSGKSGYWFVYKLTITNNMDKEKTTVVSVFMEDEEFHNNRISLFLDKLTPDEVDFIHNYQLEVNIGDYADSARKFALEKAKDIYTAAKVTWINELEVNDKKFTDYFTFKQNAYSKLHIDNIRESKLKSLEIEKAEYEQKFVLKKNIVPNIELYQIAYVEFD